MTETPQWIERYVLLYTSTPESAARVPEVFPAHHAYTLQFVVECPGQLLLTGPFPERVPGQPGAMSIFESRGAAEAFAEADPFVTEGVVTAWSVRPWLTSAEV